MDRNRGDLVSGGAEYKGQVRVTWEAGWTRVGKVGGGAGEAILASPQGALYGGQVGLMSDFFVWR